MLHKLCNNRYISYYFHYRAHEPQGIMYVWEIPCSLKISSVLHSRPQNTEINFLFLSSRPTYKTTACTWHWKRAICRTEPTSWHASHTHTQRLIYFGGRKRGLSYAAIGSKEIHFTLTQIEKDRQTHTNLNIRHTKNSLFLFRSKEQRRKIKTG